MLGMLSMLRPLLAGVAATFRRLSLQLLHLHKGVAKLGYIVTSLLSGVMQEGYCTASETEETEAGMSCWRLPSFVGSVPAVHARLRPRPQGCPQRIRGLSL